ncbi:hypothetical protein PRVXT_000543 [Proteinivorax tanatarense]|uniref:Uncharacterized protein n=1 Tax=Proteinivorax tanatarense TaxID=1260629 RepID=A0AAU7VMY7_9FIRM
MMNYFAFLAFVFSLYTINEVSVINKRLKKSEDKVGRLKRSMGVDDKDMEAKQEYLLNYLGKKCFITFVDDNTVTGELEQCQDGWIKLRLKNGRIKLFKLVDVFSIEVKD